MNLLTERGESLKRSISNSPDFKADKDLNSPLKILKI